MTFQAGSIVIHREDLDSPPDKVNLWRILDGGCGTVVLQQYEPLLKEETSQLYHVSGAEQLVKGGKVRQWGAEVI